MGPGFEPLRVYEKVRQAPDFFRYNHILAKASLGIRQSPLGERETLPTFGPSGMQLRLNCWLKNRLQKVLSHFAITASS